MAAPEKGVSEAHWEGEFKPQSDGAQNVFALMFNMISK